jgi:hypothetical protein
MGKKMEINNLRRTGHFIFKAQVNGVEKTLFLFNKIDDFVTFAVFEEPLIIPQIMSPFVSKKNKFMEYMEENAGMTYIKDNRPVTFIELKFNNNYSYELIDSVKNF